MRQSATESTLLSVEQRRFWFLDQLVGKGTAYTISEAHRLVGPAKVQVLRRSIEYIAARHEALHTVVTMTAAGPRALRAPGPLVDFRVESIPTVEAGQTLRAAKNRCRAADAEPFDLQQGPLLRTRLLRLGSEDHILFQAVHHIAADGWSMGIIRRELGNVYRSLLEDQPPNLPPTLGYFEAARARAARIDRDGSALGAYWDQQLAGAPVTSGLPLDGTRPTVATTRGVELRRRLAVSTARRMEMVARSLQVTEFALLLTAFGVLVRRWSGSEDLVIAVPTASRDHADEGTVGCFMNILPVRLTVTERETFASLARKVSATVLDALAHQELPFETIVEHLVVGRDLSGPPLASLCFNSLSYPAAPLDLVSLETSPFHYPRGASLFDLTMYVESAQGPPWVALVFNADLFERRRMESFLAEYVQLLEQALTQPDRDVLAFSLVTNGDRRRLPKPDSALDPSWRGSVPELFLRRTRALPSATAIQQGPRCFSYAEVSMRSGDLAAALGSQGIGQSDRVAVLAERSWELPVALMGILEAGAAFMILDTDHPVDRLRLLLAEAKPTALVLAAAKTNISVGRILDSWLREGRGPILGVPTNAPPSEPRAEPRPIGADDLAYVAFTSGSTGRPRGILGRHGPLTHFVPWLQSEFRLDPSDRFSLMAGLSHDPLHREIFTPLVLGASIHVPPPDALRDPPRLAEWVRRSQITVAHLTPGLLRLVAQGFVEAASGRSSLRLAFCVGDVLTWRDVELFRRITGPGAGLVALYGTTETQRAVSYALPAWPSGRSAVVRKKSVRDEVEVPLGWGIPDVQLLVVNPKGQQAGVGELGEIVFRSPHLAQGYLNSSGPEAGRFAANPWTGHSGDRTYRTGDLGRYRSDGAVQFAGRFDRQAQVRGFRVELPEVESAIASHLAVRGVAVEAVSTPGPGQPRMLRAYVDVRPPERLAELPAYLRRKLPSYMLPDTMVAVPSIPLTPNGKVDWPALRDMPSHAAKASVPGHTREMEELLLSLWSDVTGMPVPAAAEEAALSGNSLALVQLCARLQEALHREVDLVDLFSCRDLAALARALSAERSPRPASSGRQGGWRT